MSSTKKHHLFLICWIIISFHTPILSIFSGPIIATSQDLTPKGSQGRAMGPLTLRKISVGEILSPFSALFSKQLLSRWANPTSDQLSVITPINEVVLTLLITGSAHQPCTSLEVLQRTKRWSFWIPLVVRSAAGVRWERPRRRRGNACVRGTNWNDEGWK